jgi:hypothetical protein
MPRRSADRRDHACVSQCARCGGSRGRVVLKPQHSSSAFERRLLRAARSLDHADREALIAFADFLASRRSNARAEVAEPTHEPRPTKESVVGAIKRLRRSYPMLDSADLLDETSTAMSAHLMQGVAASEVIDRLEALFDTHYRRYRERSEMGKGGGAAGRSDAAGASSGEDPTSSD